MKTFSNRYIFLYSAALVAVAAVILTVVSTSLKPRQERNRQAETKQMILKTIGVEATRDNADKLYEQHITEVENGDSPFYQYDGGVVIPLKGTGLWGPIWGYMALDSTSTVVGAVFDHKGETPGLGGEISTDKFAQRFIGKKMDLQPIHLSQSLRGGRHQRRHHDQQRRDRHACQGLRRVWRNSTRVGLGRRN